MKIETRLIDGMTLAAKAESGHWVVMDSGVEVGGHDGATKPLELVLMGLAGCTGMDVVAILKKMRVDYRDMRITVEAQRVEQHPRVFSRIEIVFTFLGEDLDVEKLERAVSLSAEKYCSVSAMLEKTAEVSHRVQIEVAA